APLVLSVLLGKNHGMYAAIFVSLWGALIFPENPAYIVMGLISGFIAVYVTLQVRRRSRLIRAGDYVGFATRFLAVAFGLVEPFTFGDIDWQRISLQTFAAIGTGLVSAMIIGGA